MRPAVPAHDADRHGAAQLPVKRVVMRDRRHAGEQILEAADEQPFDQRVRPPFTNRRVVGKARSHVGDPA